MISDVGEEITGRVVGSVESMGGIEDDELCELIDNIMLEDKYRAYSVKEKLELRQDIFNSIKRLDILQSLIEDDSVTEIMINGYRNIFIERAGKIERYHKTFASREKLLDVVQRIAARSNKIVNESTPIIDTRLSDGSRVNIVMNPIAIDGPAVTIRKFYDNPLTMDRLIALGAITHEAAEYLKELVAARYNIFISGGTGSGKTTFLNLLKLIFGGNVTFNTNEDFRSQFNDDWAGKLLICVDEVLLNRREDSERIKNLSTARSYKAEAKGRDRREVEFFGKFVLCSNNERNPVLIEPNCRPTGCGVSRR